MKKSEDPEPPAFDFDQFVNTLAQNQKFLPSDKIEKKDAPAVQGEVFFDPAALEIAFLPPLFNTFLYYADYKSLLMQRRED